MEETPGCLHVAVSCQRISQQMGDLQQVTIMGERMFIDLCDFYASTLVYKSVPFEMVSSFNTANTSAETKNTNVAVFLCDMLGVQSFSIASIVPCPCALQLSNAYLDFGLFWCYYTAKCFYWC